MKLKFNFLKYLFSLIQELSKFEKKKKKKKNIFYNVNFNWILIIIYP